MGDWLACPFLATTVAVVAVVVAGTVGVAVAVVVGVAVAGTVAVAGPPLSNEDVLSVLHTSAGSLRVDVAMPLWSMWMETSAYLSKWT